MESMWVLLRTLMSSQFSYLCDSEDICGKGMFSVCPVHRVTAPRHHHDHGIRAHSAPREGPRPGRGSPRGWVIQGGARPLPTRTKFLLISLKGLFVWRKVTGSQVRLTLDIAMGN